MFMFPLRAALVMFTDKLPSLLDPAEETIRNSEHESKSSLGTL